MLPPNVKRLEVHWRKGSATNTLFEVAFTGPTVDLRLYARCTRTPSGFEIAAFPSDSDLCALRLEDDAYTALAESTRGQGPLVVRVRGTDDGGVTYGESAQIGLEMAEARVDGGVYYWAATGGTAKVMRFDFGSGTGVPEAYLTPGAGGLPNQCVGCHALSRDGARLLAGVGNSSAGDLVYVGDVKSKTLTVPGSGPTASSNRLLGASFDPSGALFVAVAPRNDPQADTVLHFHDAVTGVRSFGLDLGKDSQGYDVLPSHPDWSPDGRTIAFTRITGTNRTSVEFHGGEIDLLRNAVAWTASARPTRQVLVPAAPGKNRYNPSHMPDGSLVLYSESVDTVPGVVPGGYGAADYSCVNGRFCDGYSDPSAKTWAVVPEVGKAPVFLANAARPGLADAESPAHKRTDLMDTFARATPFKIPHRGGSLMWFTVSSQRRAGLRATFDNPSVVGDPATQQLLWMFAVDPAKVIAGLDGSYAGFFLPFQDLRTSNHMAQWTARIVSDSPPPPPPPPPVPPPVPPPPPPPR